MSGPGGRLDRFSVLTNHCVQSAHADYEVGCAPVFASVRPCVCLSVCVRKCAHVCLWMFVCICTCVCMRAYLCTRPRMAIGSGRNGGGKQDTRAQIWR